MGKRMQWVANVIGVRLQMSMELAGRDPLIPPHSTLQGRVWKQRNKGHASITQPGSGRAWFQTQVVWLQAQGTLN